MESRYSVRQAADITGVKPYVLRYWEDELELEIQRNEMGHRYYTEEDIQLFKNIKELKRRGLQLRAVKELLPELREEIQGEKITPVSEENNTILQLKNTLQEERKEKEIGNEKAAAQDDEKILEFQAILERLILREMSFRDEDEERCRSLDMAIRRQQLVRKETAVASEKMNGKRGRARKDKKSNRSVNYSDNVIE